MAGPAGFPSHMRAPVAILLAGLMLVPSATILAPNAGAVHEERIQPAVEPSHALRAALYDVNRTIGEVEDQYGDGPGVRDAKDKRALAARSFVAGNHWLTLSHLLEAESIIRRVQVTHENEGASDPDAAYFSDMEAKWRESEAWITDLHKRLIDLQSTGVDLWVLDHVLLAGAILAKAERMHKAWGGVAKSWERGQREQQMKNALAAFSYGTIQYSQIADGIITRALRNQTDEPVGPIVGNATLRGIMDSLQPMIRNGSVSFDRQMSGIINGNIAEGEWLAALGATVTWSEKQAPAAVQHTLDEPESRYEPERVVRHLYNVTHNDTTLQTLDEMGVAGAEARGSLQKARVTLEIVMNETERGNTSIQTSLRAAEGLGAISAAHTSTAILKVAAGESPPDEIIHLPIRSGGGLELSNGTNTTDTDDEDGAPVGSWWLWVGAMGALAIGAFAVRRRRRR